MLPLLTLIEREMVRFFRQRSRIIGALGTPLLFWLFLGAGIGRTFSTGPGVDFQRYFFPGILTLIVFFTAIFSTISVIEDRREGFLQSVLVAPVSRLTVALGKIAGGGLIALLQAGLFLALAPLGGIPLSGSVILPTLGALALVAAGLTGLGFLIAWQMDSTQGFHAIMNVFLIPLWILSGSAFPAEGAHGWLAAIMAGNPMTYGVALIRRCLDPEAAAMLSGLPSLSTSLLVTVGFTAAMILASALVTQRRALVVGHS
jgi:ABC-2 type transport system permease protein